MKLVSWSNQSDTFEWLYSDLFLHDSPEKLLTNNAAKVFRQSIPMSLLTQFSSHPLMSQNWKVCLNQIVTELLQIVMDIVYP